MVCDVIALGDLLLMIELSQLIGPVVGLGIIWGPLPFVLSVSSGWKSLADKYPDKGLVPNYSCYSGRIGSFDMGLLRICLSGSGLHVKSAFPLPFFKPFVLPWGDIAAIEEKQFLFSRSTLFKLSDSRITISLSANLAAEARSYQSS